MPPYTHFQYIAYQVPTVVRDRRNGTAYVSGLDPGSECAQIQRVRLPEVQSNDARKRLKRLAAVVDMAATQVQALGTNDSTLKVFVAPEFYFRPVKVNDTYNHNTYPPTAAFEIFNALDSVFARADFADWLIVGGTVLWNTGTNSPLYRNTAVHVQGGKENGLMIVEKRVASGIDGVPVAMTPAMTNDLSIRQIHDEFDVRKQHFFHVDNVGIGLEVCLDHYNRTLVNIQGMRSMRSLFFFHDINLQVLTAGGMYIEPEAVAAEVGGYFLRNDGLPDERLLPDGQIELMKVTGRALSNRTLGIEAQLQRVAKLGYLPIQGNMQVPATGIDPQEFDQRLVFYPTQPLS